MGIARSIIELLGRLNILSKPEIRVARASFCSRDNWRGSQGRFVKTYNREEKHGHLVRHERQKPSLQSQSQGYSSGFHFAKTQQGETIDGKSRPSIRPSGFSSLGILCARILLFRLRGIHINHCSKECPKPPKKGPLFGV